MDLFELVKMLASMSLVFLFVGFTFWFFGRIAE